MKLRFFKLHYPTMKFAKSVFSIFLITLFVYFSFGQERLIMVGGGDRPPDVLSKIVELSGGEKGKLLVITWASGVPEESFEAFKKDIESVSKITIINAPIRPLNESGKIKFLEQLKVSSGVFFTGGDQNRVMEVLQDKELLQAIKVKYKSGTLFAGTSAGTAIMSQIMITGEGDFTVINGDKVETKDGIGLIPQIIVDQHFIKRLRQNRLLGLVLKNPNFLGVGIDEDTALFVKDNRFGEVLGNSQIMIFDAKKEPIKFFIIKKGERFDLEKRKKINGK